MFTNDPNNPICRIADKLEENLVKIELTMLAVILAGIIMAVADIDAGHTIFTIGLGILAILYFITAFTSAMQESTAIPVNWKSFLHKITFWGFAIAVTGMLFFINEWQGYNIMLICSSAVLIISLFLTTMAIHKHDAGDEYGQSYWMRFMLVAGLSCYSLYKLYLPDILAFL